MTNTYERLAAALLLLSALAAVVRRTRRVLRRGLGVDRGD
jgi:hypothetical protein